VALSSRATCRLRTASGAWCFISPRTRRDTEHPFGFLATYTTRLSRAAKAQHVPLGEALREYGGARQRQALLAVLLPVQRKHLAAVLYGVGARLDARPELLFIFRGVDASELVAERAAAALSEAKSEGKRHGQIL